VDFVVGETFNIKFVEGKKHANIIEKGETAMKLVVG